MWDRVPDPNRVVFVVDDEAVIAQALAVILNQAGFQARAFDHPEEAIIALMESAPDLLLSDVMMPGMTGVELAIHFRKTRPECHDFDLLPKPIHPADLLAKLRS